MIRTSALRAALLLAATATATPALAQSPGPQPLPMPPALPTPRDTPYPGTLTLAVDVTDTQRRVVTVHETIPVAAGQPTTLLFPKWHPGEHSPNGEIKLVGGVMLHGGGQRLEWTRDPVEVYAFHVDVPQNVTSLDVDFQYLSPTAENQGRVSIAPNLVDLKWINVALYPAGYYVRQIPVTASVTLPDGWQYATALETASADHGHVRFQTTSFETLMDSPLIAGRYFQKIDLNPGGRSRVTLNMMADRPEDLVAKPEYLKPHLALIQQADRLYGARHYDHYDFLFWQSDTLGGEGLEHHRSSEDGVDPGYFAKWDTGAAGRDLLSHEYTHSWNGKFRRPADLWTPSYDVPMRDSLLWVYEGQTQYWGQVLAARSGLISKQDALDSMALTAANLSTTPGRAWKPLIDTTNDPIVQDRTPEPWGTWQRGEDYYEEGKLIWLDADTLIRERTKNKRSLDDFARTFFGIDDGSYVPVTYQFDDVVAALNAVMPYDWATFLHARLTTHTGAPLDGLARGGYRLVYTDKESYFFKSAEGRRKLVSFGVGPGFVVGKEAMIGTVLWDSPAFKAGLTRGTKLIAVNGVAYDDDQLKDAVAATAKGGTLDLTVQDGERVRTTRVAYTGGLRYPHLERIPGTAARLDDIFAPRTK